MKTPLLIIAGFLGAGKTTYIQQLVQQIPSDKRLMVIENDFGQVSFDTTVLRNGDVDVTELRQGCICCSLRGDFTTALIDALDRNSADLIIIEPSGVGLLSDILNACNDPALSDRVDLQQIITIVDVQRCPLYLKNFGPFYKDQIHNAHTLELSHQEDAPADRVELAKTLLREQNSDAQLIDTPWDTLNLWQMVSGAETGATTEATSTASDAEADSVSAHHEHGEDCTCGCHDHEHGHDHNHDGEHDHDHAHGHDHVHPFETTTVSLTKPQPLSFYEARLAEATKDGSPLVRAKGIVPVLTESGATKYYALQVVSGAYELEPIDTIGHELTLIVATTEHKNSLAELAKLFEA